MNNLMSFKYWINTRPGSLSPLFLDGLVVFLVLLFAGFITLQFLKKHNNRIYFRIFEKLSTFTFANFFIGLMLTFFSFELIPVLSARFWYLLWFVGMVTWLAFIFRELKKIPEKKKKLQEKQEFQKYIP